MSEETFWVLVEKPEHNGFYNLKVSEATLQRFWLWYKKSKEEANKNERGNN